MLAYAHALIRSSLVVSKVVCCFVSDIISLCVRIEYRDESGGCRDDDVTKEGIAPEPLHLRPSLCLLSFVSVLP